MENLTSDIYDAAKTIVDEVRPIIFTNSLDMSHIDQCSRNTCFVRNINC